MSLRICVAYDSDEHVQSRMIEHVTNNIYNNIVNVINKIYPTNVNNIYMELLHEEGFNNLISGNKEFLNDPLRIIKPFGKYDNFDAHQ
jgi:hypothetical protein